MNRIVSYIRFLLRSTNQHGVHSPFVYNLLTKCLYKKDFSGTPKFDRILLKSISYFKYKSLFLTGVQEDLRTILKKEFPDLYFDQPAYDLIAIGRGGLAQFDLDSLYPLSHNKSMILIEGIHGGKSDFSLWNDLCEDPRIRVSIDYYFGGILFLRQEQEKQHFRIRI